MPTNTKSQNIFGTFWWLLWISAIVLLECYYRDQTGERVKILHGQYWFFAIAVLSSLGMVISLKKWLLEFFFLSKTLVISLSLLFSALAFSAAFGIKAVYGVRLLGILMVTSLPFVLIGLWSHSILDKKKILPLLVVSAICAFGACILAVTGPVSWAGFTLENYLMNNRWAFLFIEANGLAGMMALGLTVTLFQIHVSRSQTILWILGLLVLPIIFLVFWKTNSRGSLLWILVTLFFYGGLMLRNLALQFKNIDFGRFFLPVLASIIGLCVLLLVIFGQELSAFLRLDQRDLTTGRMEIWLMYLEQFKNNPLLGFGFGASDELMSDYVVTGDYTIAGPLNVFVGMLGETGFLGFTAMLWLWFGAIYKAWQVVKSRLPQQDGNFHYAFFLMVTLISLAAHQNGEWQLIRITPFNFLFFFLLSAASTLPKQEKTQSCKA
jgi:O-antigen ligase